MIPHHIEDLCGFTLIQRVSAKDEHLEFLNGSVEQLFKLGKVIPSRFSECSDVACYVACHPHPIVALSQSSIEFLYPISKYPVYIEFASFEEVLDGQEELDLAALYVAIELRHNLCHCVSGVFFIPAGRSHPQTEFVILQPRFEIWNQEVHQAFWGFVEVTVVRPPRCLVNARDA